MDATFMQQQAYQRLDVIQEKADALIKYAQRARKLVERGLANDVDGLRTYEVVAQYGELMAMQANLLKAHADAMAMHMRTLKP